MNKLAGRMFDVALYFIGRTIAATAPLIVIALGWTNLKALSKRYGV